jgi:transcriptional regulator with XRE-family HTH domain/Zn-dependent peptidase ImmA (M78 family)
METDLNFVGKNIRFFRRSRNWTISQLASKAGIQEPPLGRIERGLNLPSAKVLHNLSKALNISMDSLFAKNPSHTPDKDTATTDVFFVTPFVTIDKNPQIPPKSLLKACHEIMTAFHALEDICKAQKHAYLPLSIPFVPTYKGMDELATRIRQYFGTGSAVVFDYFELFENAGMRIILFPFTRGATKMESISFYEPSFHNAFFFLNSRHNPEKQLFSLCLELGKILISNQIKLQGKSLFPKQTRASQNKINQIKQNQTSRPINPQRAAKRFAATMLMPNAAVQTTVSQLGITPDNWSYELLLRIKHRFGISAQAFLYRLNELDLIFPATSEKLDKKIKEYYKKTDNKEPDSTRRILTPNGRFFDLLLTAENMDNMKDEIKQIKNLQQRLKIIHK